MESPLGASDAVYDEWVWLPTICEDFPFHFFKAFLALGLVFLVPQVFIGFKKALKEKHEVMGHANEVSLLRSRNGRSRPGLLFTKLVLFFIEDLLDIPTELVEERDETWREGQLCRYEGKDLSGGWILKPRVTLKIL